MQIGPYTLPNNVFVAPMAGVTDRPFRALCKSLGAGYAVSEMAASDPRLRDSVKTQRRMDHAGETEPRAVQIAGADPQMMAHAARYNVERGAQIIDINMGCPARKVCNVMAGSALMADEPLALSIVAAVRAAVDVPVTVKMRVGVDDEHITYLDAGRIAEAEGVAAVALHGRTASQAYSGQADWSAIARLKETVPDVPILGNGDVWSAEDAVEMVRRTGCDGVVVGRGCLGRPWLFADLAADPDRQMRVFHVGCDRWIFLLRRDIDRNAVGGEVKLAGQERLVVGAVIPGDHAGNEVLVERLDVFQRLRRLGHALPEPGGQRLSHDGRAAVHLD